MNSKKILILFFVVQQLSLLAQLSSNEQQYNSFTSRSFVKFNRFLTSPTFSLLYEDNTAVSALVRNENVEFEDSPSLYLFTGSGKFKENVGMGVAVYQQELGVFKDFGVIGNYARKVQLGDVVDLIFGFNVSYSNRAAVGQKVLSENQDDPLLSNFQNVHAVNLQPALTFSYGGVYAGVFAENLVDYNLKKGEMITQFADKTIAAHLGYNRVFESASGFFQDSNVNIMAIARKQTEGFGYGANLIYDMPKLGWLKVGYDKTYGYGAGLGVNINRNLSLGFSYDKGVIGTTNEIGIIYKFGDKSIKRSPPVKTSKTNKANPVQTKEENSESNNKDYSDEFKRAQDSINKLNRKVDEVLRLLKNKPKQVVVRDTVTIQRVDTVKVASEKDTSLKRSASTPWREKEIIVTNQGGGGTSYYVAVNQFKDLKKVKDKMSLYKKKKVKTKYVLDPKTKLYYIYIERFTKAKDAERVRKEINGGKKGFENDIANDLGIKIKSVSKDPVFVVKITFKAGDGEAYKEPKTNPPARVIPVSIAGVPPGYYLRVNIFSKKPFADKFIDELRVDNIDADYFTDPKTGFMHAYIYTTQDRAEAIRMYNNNLNGSYYDRKYIVQIR